MGISDTCAVMCVVFVVSSLCFFGSQPIDIVSSFWEGLVDSLDSRAASEIESASNTFIVDNFSKVILDGFNFSFVWVKVVGGLASKIILIEITAIDGVRSNFIKRISIVFGPFSRKYVALFHSNFWVNSWSCCSCSSGSSCCRASGGGCGLFYISFGVGFVVSNNHLDILDIAICIENFVQVL